VTRLRVWYGSLRRTVRRTVRRALGRTVLVVVEDPPDRPLDRVLYVVGGPAPWCAVLLCPCRCGATIAVSLVAADRPSWTFAADAAERPTLAPSIHRTVGCRSHFFLRSGRIVWAGLPQEGRRTARDAHSPRLIA
jgi:hypothetical protein